MTKLCKAVIFWHPQTMVIMKAWPHGWEMLSIHGTWDTVLKPKWHHGVCYRAKPEPIDNLIEREGKKEIVDGYALWVALDAAHNLITTMTGGHLDKIQEYERAIK